MSIAAACARIEANDPPIRIIRVRCGDMTLSNEIEPWLEVTCTDSFGKEYEYNDHTFEMAHAWGRLGKAIQGIDLDELEHFHFASRGVDAGITPPKAACLDALFGQIKYARSIEKFRISIYPGNQVPTFDLRQFVQSNKSLQELWIDSFDILTPDQVDVMQEAIAATRLELLCIHTCRYANDGSLEQILSACTNVEHMRVHCEFTSHYSALLMLLQDPTNILETIDVHARTNIDGPEDNEIVRQFTSVLANNTKLKGLDLNLQRGEMSPVSNDYFHKLLCDPTSIESIYNSNHTLKYMAGSPHWGFLNGFLELNSNEDKTQVARNKILRYYFVEDFDVTPFTKMPMSVVPEVISQIRSDTKQSAIFRLLKSIPELSHVANRCLSSQQYSTMKRQKISV
ncbi:hypothetical protein ACHAXN_000361 [Cyclotella atomus]